MPHQMRTREIEVSDVTGAKTRAQRVQCNLCQGEQWLVYLIQGQYQHLQCLGCGTSYCAHEGPCHGATPHDQAS